MHPLEIKRLDRRSFLKAGTVVGDTAQRNGIGMALQAPATPICFMAAVHCAAVLENILVVDCDVDNASWRGVTVDGQANPVINKGCAMVPDGPGLGITLAGEDWNV